MDLSKLRQEVQRSKDLLLRLSEDLYRKGDLKGMSSIKSLSDDIDLFISELQYSKVDAPDTVITTLLYRADDLNRSVRYIMSGKDTGLGTDQEISEIRLGFSGLKDAVADLADGHQPKLREADPRSILGRQIKASYDARSRQYWGKKLAEKKTQVRGYLKYYKDNGYDISRLEEILKLNDINQINKGYQEYYGDVKKLQALKDKLEDMKKKIKKKGHEREYEKAMEMLKDPANLEEMEGMVDYFREKAEDDRFSSDTSDWIKNYHKRREKEAEKAAKEAAAGGGRGGMSIPSSRSDAASPAPAEKKGFQIPTSKSDIQVPTSATPPPNSVQPPSFNPPQSNTPVPPTGTDFKPPTFTPPGAGGPTPPVTTGNTPVPPNITPPQTGGAPVPPNIPPPQTAVPPTPPQPAYAAPPQPPAAPPAGGGEGYQGRSLEEIVENGTKEEWSYLFNIAIRNEIKIELPPAEPEKGKFPDYGYKNLVKLLLESKDAVRIITEERDISGYKMIELSTYLRGDENTTRGLGALCDLILNGEAYYDPTMQTEFKYMNILLDCAAPMEKEGKMRVWDISTHCGQKKVTAVIEDGQWTYRVEG